jgi:hypothetical protein
MQLMTFARWLARKAVTAEWRAEGRKVQYINVREITNATNIYLSWRAQGRIDEGSMGASCRCPTQAA